MRGLSRKKRILVLLPFAAVVIIILPFVPVMASFQAPRAFQGDETGTISGYTSPLFLLSGQGRAPFGNPSFVNLDDESAFAFFTGARLAYIEGPFIGPSAFEPPGAVEIQNISAAPATGGLVNFTATVRNIGSLPIFGATAFLDYPGYGSNITYAGVLWHSLPSQACASPLPPDGTCEVTLSEGPQLTLSVGTAYQAGWVVEGTENRTDFVYRVTSPLTYPGSGPNPAWVGSFASLVNDNRTGPALVENSSLDAFAAMRFQTAVSQFTISDYGFDRQAAAFFGGTVSSYNEEILYPSSFTPYQFAAYLGQSAPGHWNELTNPSYRQFGYFLGTGPAVVVNDCSVTEITSMNINITQFAIQHGCDYKVQNVIYLIIVLSS